jgi:hypothetical protein
VYIRTARNIRQCGYARDLNLYAPGNSDAWYHVAYTFDASAKIHRLYRNGVLVAQGVNSAAITPSGALWIGRNSQYDFGTFQGLLDEAKIYNRALSAAEVLADYQAAASVSNRPVILAFGASPTAVVPGESTSLSWSTSGATSMSITPGAGQLALALHFPRPPDCFLFRRSRLQLMF